MDAFFGDSAIWFGIPALAGTLFFTLRIILMLTLGDLTGESDFGGAGDAGDFGGPGVDLGSGAEGAGELGGFDAAELGEDGGFADDMADAAGHAKNPADPHTGDHGSAILKYLSIQSILAFVMGFGWGGLFGYRGLELNPALSGVVGVVIGIGMVRLLIFVLEMITRLNQSGNITRSDLLGLEGSVYIAVPARGGGRGRVSILIENRQRMISARSADAELPRNARVKVVKLNNDNTVTVEPVA